MYALALKFNSVWLLLIGRFLCGYVHSWMLPLIGKCWNSCVKTVSMSEGAWKCRERI
jgi:hypothetical protein